MILERLSDVNREFRIKVPQNVYLLYGPDVYLKTRYFNQIMKMVLPEGATIFNYHRITSKVVDTGELEELLSQISFGGKTLVAIQDFQLTAQGDKDFKELLRIIGEVQEGVVLTIVVGDGEFDDKKSAKAKKLIKAVDGNGAVCKLGFEKKSDLADFIRQQMERKGSPMEMAIAYGLIDYCGDSVDELLKEVEKLSHYSTGEKITLEMIRHVCTPTIEGNVYQISREMLKGNLPQVMTEIDKLLYNRVDPFRIVSTLGYNFGDLLGIKLGMEQGIIGSEIKSTLKLRMPENVLSMQMRDIRLIPLSNLAKASQLILEGEYTLKTVSSDSRITLEKMVTEVMYWLKK